MSNTLQEVSDAFDRVIADGFSFFASFYGKKWHVTLNKYTYQGVALEVKGNGDTIFEAVETALNNFPKNPLDGSSRWASDRLTHVENGEFTETQQ